MNEREPERLGRAMAMRLKSRPEFLAWVFAELGRQGLDEASITARLGVPASRFLELSLCPTPRTDRFAQDLDDLVREFGVDGPALSALVRQADIVSTITRSPRPSGWLMAAREKEQDPRDRGGAG